MPKQTSACAMYDFVYDCSGNTSSYVQVLTQLKGLVKKVVFQLEKGDTGYKHFQGRLSLMKKRRKPEILKLFKSSNKIMPRYFQPTSNAKFYTGDNFYVMKLDTRIEGPWTEEHFAVYIPRQVREMTSLRPFQKTIIESRNIWDTRTINVIYDEKGFKGKSRLTAYIRAYKYGRYIPCINSYQDIMAIVLASPTSQMYVFDIPRAVNQKKLHEMYSAIETIKDGYAFDTRYKFQEKTFDCPQIWIFTNSLPDENLMSKDRWKIYTICEKTFRLIKYGTEGSIKNNLFQILAEPLGKTPKNAKISEKESFFP